MCDLTRVLILFLSIFSVWKELVMCHPARLLPYIPVKMHSSNSTLYWMASFKCSNYRIQFVNQNITNKLYESCHTDYPICMLQVQLKYTSSLRTLPEQITFLSRHFLAFSYISALECTSCVISCWCSCNDLLSRSVYTQTAEFLLCKNGIVFILCKEG